MTLSNYYTVKENGFHEIIIQKSRFITYLARATTEEQAQAFISELKKKHHDANHNCSAYVIGERNEIQKANDDGEPSGTAGVPMLEVLKKRDLRDTVVVVTRYFGGIKLGGGGLIRAYGSSVSEALNAVGVVERIEHTVVSVNVDYTWLGKLENELRASVHPIDQIHYLDQVQIDVLVKTADVPDFLDWMTNMTNGQAELSSGSTRYLERDIIS
ncbi:MULTISPECIES: YigZ family protein [unclassified Exiguobacterium]|uniref:YigZ family protein n=1 Tax=unclassified Exiguobacterium TaxID=2644629 RepID=UPI000E81FB79|nr:MULTISPECIES: YigZ family protein [unclassified Exiguobacterium]MDT0173547.1 YigZ family protein [Exiguobacterium sp. BRG2]HBF57984.1 YigZ family protein [Exiguobacterium sp.]HCV53034.1 YigZ family protein [Exiguobacterium sp.]